jgi:hypothetical protein
MEPIKVNVTMEAWGKVTLDERDILEMRSIAEYHGKLDDEDYLWDQINECINSHLDPFPYSFEMDFDWDGVDPQVILDAIRGVDENGDPLPPPELEGQLSIEDVITELV